MSEFSMADAIALCMASVKNRKSSGGSRYVLLYSNNASSNRYEGKIVGSTIKFLIEEFRANGGAFRFAVIYREGDFNKPLRYFDRALSKKFFSMTRGKKK
jgi:hypothetical protein